MGNHLRTLGLLSLIVILLGGSVHVASAVALDLTLSNNAFVSAADMLTLDSSTAPSSYADALFDMPAPPTFSSSSADLSFTTFFSFSVNSTYRDGVLAFIMTPDADLPGRYPSLLTATPSSSPSVNDSAFALIINVTHSTPSPAVNGTQSPSRSLSIAARVSSPFLYLDIAINSSVSDDGPFDEYQASIEYTDALNQSILSLSPTDFLSSVTYNFTRDLSTVLANSTKVGLLSTGGGVFNVSQWNLTSHGSFNQILQAENENNNSSSVIVIQGANGINNSATPASNISPRSLLAFITLGLAASLLL